MDVASFRLRAFLEHPDALLDPVKAAMEIGYVESTAKAKAYGWRQEHMQVLVEKMRARLEGLGVTPDWVKNEVKVLADTAMADFIEFIEENGKQIGVLKEHSKIDPKKWRAAIKEVEFDSFVHTDGSIRSRISWLKLYDRQAALVELGNLLGMKNEKLMLLNAPQAAEKSDDAKVMEFMTVEELETIATIQEKAAARMRKAASTKRDANAITIQPSGSGGSAKASVPKLSGKKGKQQTAAPPPTSEYDKEY
jgi:hypothetical protein